MPLTLTIRNADRLDNGSPISLVLDRRGGIIGRAPTVDWPLPDPTLHISSRHCEVQFRDGAYTLNDISTNGTFLAGSQARLPGPHAIQAGDVFMVGPFEIVAALDEATASAMAARNAAPPPPQWKGWNSDDSGPAPAAPASASGWDAVPVGSAMSGTGPMSQNWAAPKADAASLPPPSPAPGWGSAPAAQPQASPAPGWGTAAVTPSPAPAPVSSAWSQPEAPQSPASDWSVPASASPPPPPAADDIWGKIASSNTVDWARGGFGSPPAPPPTPFAPAALPAAPPPVATAMAAQPTEAPVTAPPVTSVPSPSAGLAQLLAAAGLDPSVLKQDEGAAIAQAGDVLRRLVAGLVVMLEARARAKSQLGAAGTSLEFDGNNPLKFARAPEQALAQLINPPERGFMSADRAIEDAYRDLQAHQVATLKAMQGALRSTLDRFSPTAIRARADNSGVLTKILPGAKDAALWKAYEREFGGVAQGSDEAFMDVFSKEFRKAYEEAARK